MAEQEYHIGDSLRNIVMLKDGAVPREGEFINIRGLTYKVRRVTWTADNADKILEASLRANVELEIPQ